MFSPTSWEFKETVAWVTGPVSTLALSECAAVDPDPQGLIFIHSGGRAVLVPFSNIRYVNGKWVEPTVVPVVAPVPRPAEQPKSPRGRPPKAA